MVLTQEQKMSFVRQCDQIGQNIAVWAIFQSDFFAKEVKCGALNTYKGSVSKNKLTKAKN